MKRRVGSFFYKSKTNQEEIRRKRWNWPSIIGRAIKKTCLVLGAVMLFSIVMGIIGAIFIGEKTSKTMPDDMILVLNVEDPMTESAAQPTITSPLSSSGLTVQEVVATLDRASTDKRVRGILVSLDNGQLELSHVQELRAAIKHFRESGKFAHLYTASFSDLGSGIGAYYLASAFDEIWMQPIGFVSMTGISIEMPFAKKVLDKVGAKAQFLHREEYKSAMETFTNETMSAPNREMMTSILNDFSSQIFKDIAFDRQLTPNVLKENMDKGLLTGDEAIKAKLIDHLDYSDELVKSVRGKITGDKNSQNPPIVMAEDYYDATKGPAVRSGRANVALVHITGEIIPGADPKPGYATGDYIASAIQDAADDSKIRVIVIRIDSPGGSPTASETIRHAIVYAKSKQKKIIVSMGPVAASGGYWIAVDADKIFALPSTLTGSIGVIMGKFELSELWDKIGVKWDSLSWGKNARLWSMNAPLDADATERLNTVIDNTYDAFLERVAKGRNLKKDYVRSIAKGRAWTGMQGKQNGLVDELGGLNEAMDYAAKLVGTNDRSKLRVILLPKPESALEQLLGMVGQSVGMGRFFGLDGGVIAKKFAPIARQIETSEKIGPVQVYDPALRLIHP